MAVAMWIRNNMLGTSNQIERQLTEAELKVQRSLQKLSIPDWYLNKRSAPPKILKNVAPIESRPSPWKCIPAKKMLDSDPKFFARYPSGTYRISGRVGNSSNSPKLHTDTYKVPPKNETFSNIEQQSNSCSINDQTFEVKTRRKYVSKTFPKVSPSRKIQNINIVFPPAAGKLESSIEETETEVSLNEAICASEQETKCSAESRKKSFEREDEEEEACNESYKTPQKTPEVQDFVDSFASDDYRTPLKTPDPRYKFKVRAMSTPQGSPASLFSSTTIEEDANPPKRLPSWYVRARNLFEAPANPRDAQVPRRLPLPPRQISPDIPAKKPSSSSARKVVRRSSIERVSSATRRFFSARNKSTELENIVKSSEEARAGRRLVREIIQALSDKCEANTSTSSAQSYPRSAQSYVKKLVRALESGRKSEAQQIIEERRKAEGQQREYEESESSDTDSKSAACSTSISISDTESGSESDQRSPNLPDTKDRFRYDEDVLGGKAASKQTEEVHWIQVPRCKMPRTSSLLSMMSRLSTGSGQRSPCVSPIKCSTDCTQTLHTGAWGSTYKKSGNAPLNQLFPIDETVVTDSGYSEKSDRSSSAGSSAADVSWSTQTTGYNYVPAGVSRKIVY